VTEPGSRDRRDIREAPLFIVRSGKAEFGETRERAIAQFLYPRGGRGVLIRELLQPPAGPFRNGAHILPTASGSS
jgi:hypothetical protein